MGTIFITGSSSGLRRATAKLFASKEWKVIASMRDLKKEKELGNIASVTLMALDVTDPSAIERAAEQVVALTAIGFRVAAAVWSRERAAIISSRSPGLH